MRTIRRIHPAHSRPIGDLKTFCPLPSPNLRLLDPFLLLNHHGYQHYGPDNQGMPFGPHPHRGMETVTFIIEGDIVHKDTGGHQSIIKAGGVQWMTAGSGLMHAELSSEEFKKEGGPLEILQLWVNLPARLKMTSPSYKGLQKEEISSTTVDEGKVQVKVVSGQFEKTSGAFDTLTPVSLATIHMKTGGIFATKVPTEHTILCYIIRGSVQVMGEVVGMRNLIEFSPDDEMVQLEATKDAVVLFGHAKPLGEPVVSGGPFVMNTQAEIHQAYEDFHNGKFGVWQD